MTDWTRLVYYENNSRIYQEHEYENFFKIDSQKMYSSFYTIRRYSNEVVVVQKENYKFLCVHNDRF